MKTKIFSTLAVVVSLHVFSQEKIANNYTVKIDSIVSSEKQKMNLELDQVELQFKQGKMNSQEMYSQKRSIAEKYEKIINSKVDQEQVVLQKITKQAAVASVFKKDHDTIVPQKHIIISGTSVKFKKNKDKSPKDYLKNNDLAVSYGFLNLSKESGSFNPFETDSKMRIGNSHSFEIQARRERQLGGFESPFFIRYGLAYRSDTYMPKRPMIFEQDNEQLYLTNFAEGSLKRSKLRNVYLTLPVDFQWVLNPQFTDFEGKRYLDGKKKQFRLGVGAYAGVNLRSIIKVKYYDHNNDFQKYQNVIDYGVNPFLFGAKLSLSYGGFNLFIKKDFTPIFNGNANLPHKNGIQIGLELTSIDF